MAVLTEAISGKFFSLGHGAARRRISALLLCVLGLMLAASPAIRAEEEVPGPDDLAVSAEMENVLETALASHRSELGELRAQMEPVESLQDAVLKEIQTYSAQNSAHRELLLVSRLRIEDLENAVINNRRASRLLSERIKALQERWDATSFLVQQADDRIELARNQQFHIGQSPLPDARKQELAAASRSLLKVLHDKKELARRFLSVYQRLLVRLEAVAEENRALGEKLAMQLERRSQTSLLKRFDRLARLSGSDLLDSLRLVGRRIGAFFSPEAWRGWWAQIRMGGYFRWAVFLALLVFLTSLQGRCRNLMTRIIDRYEDPDHYYRRLGLILAQRSLLLADMTLFFGIYSSFQFSLLDIGLGRFLFEIFLLFLITRWGLDYLALGFQGPPTDLRSFVSWHLRRFFVFIRWIGAGIILLAWLAGISSPLTFLATDVLAAVSFVWSVIFWRSIEPKVQDGLRKGQPAPDPRRIFMFKAWSYAVLGIFLFAGLLGYSFLAEYWISAWIKTVAILFWGAIVRKSLWEWGCDHRARAAAADASAPLGSAHHLRWSLIQMLRLAWLVILAAGIVWSWDRSGILMSALIRFFGATFTIGSLSLSIKNVALAMIVLWVTHGAVGVSKALLREKILDRQGLERGVKHSILTITGYLGWGIGLVLALGILGINATSLAVVFGALSIGIGFGLQTIFNNFISGLILLFERPIQVGDIVEVGGLWAEVKKISVRATVVQIFDNASVIIPNAELISQRVTNWSFKDQRMRRNLEIGVAYGSDIDQVKTTMLDIAGATNGVLKYPRPEVIFIDHAESALIFRLRVWIHVDDFWGVPSQIRTEIDRRFREAKIEIAFPQRDLHIRSIAGVGPPASDEGKPAEPAPDKAISP